MARKIAARNVRLKRAYDEHSPDDGTRVLVDRLWPRGLKKTDAAIDIWMKELAPSTELRQWFGHDPERWQKFQSRFAGELHGHSDELEKLRDLARKGPVTLIYSARDEEHNDAVVLRAVLLGD